LAATGEIVSVNVSMAMAKADGWTKNAKYRSIPEQMLRYRSATWLIRLYCPEVTCGMQSTDELKDSDTLSQRKINPVSNNNAIEQLAPQDSVAALNAKIIEGSQVESHSEISVVVTEDEEQEEPVLNKPSEMVEAQPQSQPMF
jgi:hypothetical protein